MATPVPGTFRIFRLFGIQVYLHWLWFALLVLVVVQDRRFGGAVPWLWSVAEFVGLFAIVLMHEFGHALAARSVGGVARQIVLWPLGGIAFVQPPRRPGAVLWSIAAGPLVNVLLIPLLTFLVLATGSSDWIPSRGDNLQVFVGTLWLINIILLAFNMMPIYPLDGGQILQAILWFFIGEGRSLRAASLIGLIAAGLGGLAALAMGDLWLIILAVFVGMQAWRGFRMARMLLVLERQRELSLDPWALRDADR